jgi:hypothetical protein
MALPDTLTVDASSYESADTDLTFVEHDKSQSGKATYIDADNHSTTERHTMDLYRTPSTPSGNNLGTRRFALKFTDDFTVSDAEGNDVVRPAITQVSFAIPEGLTEAQCRALLRKIATACLSAEALNEGAHAGLMRWEITKSLKYLAI